MINYTKDDVKKSQITSIIKINLLNGVCLFYIGFFLFHMLGYYYQDNLKTGVNMYSYAISMTGSYMLLFSLLLPIVLYFYKRSITKTYKEEMKQPGEILFYSGEQK